MEARANIIARDFWFCGQRAFFDVRNFDPNTQHHENKTLKRYYELKARGEKTLQLQNFEY